MNAPPISTASWRRRTSLGLALVLTLPSITSPLAALAVSLDASPYPLIARGGGGGGARGGGGGARGGGGAARGGGGAARGGGGARGGGDFGGGRSGFQNTGGAGGLNRGTSRPTGGWSQSVRGNAPSPGLSRPASRPSGGFNGADRTPGSLGGIDRTPGSIDRSNLGNRTGLTSGDRSLGGDGSFNRNGNLNRGNLDGNLNRGNLDRNVNGQRMFNGNVNSNWSRNWNVNNVNLSPGWARPGWGYARPWGTGWYGGWATPGWGWWGANAALWGISTLASAAVINAAVDAAVSSNTTYIVVPQTNYQLLFGTVQPVGSQGVSFLVQADDGSTYNLTADCNAGTIDGVAPNSAAQAELLNAACQVAYGSAS